jgi:hypothetical protein
LQRDNLLAHTCLMPRIDGKRDKRMKSVAKILKGLKELIESIGKSNSQPVPVPVRVRE